MSCIQALSSSAIAVKNWSLACIGPYTMRLILRRIIIHKRCSSNNQVWYYLILKSTLLDGKKLNFCLCFPLWALSYLGLSHSDSCRCLIADFVPLLGIFTEIFKLWLVMSLKKNSSFAQQRSNWIYRVVCLALYGWIFLKSRYTAISSFYSIALI